MIWIVKLGDSFLFTSHTTHHTQKCFFHVSIGQNKYYTIIYYVCYTLCSSDQNRELDIVFSFRKINQKRIWLQQIDKVQHHVRMKMTYCAIIWVDEYYSLNREYLHHKGLANFLTCFWAKTEWDGIRSIYYLNKPITPTWNDAVTSNMIICSN